MKRIAKPVGIAAALATIATGAAITFAAPASARTVSNGPGMMIDGDFVGPYHLLSGLSVQCADPGKANGTPTGSTVVGSLDGYSASQVHQLAYFSTVFLSQTNAGARHGTDKAYGAATRITMLKLIGDGSGATYYKDAPSDRVRTLADEMTHDSKNFAGPYKPVVKFDTTAIVGETGKAHVFVKSLTSGKLVPHQKLSLFVSTTNAQLSSKVVTSGSGGNAHFTYTPVDHGPVRISATTSLPSTKLRLWHPAGSTYQRYISMVPKKTVSGSAGYQKFPSGTVTYACDTQCDGVPPVHVKFCNKVHAPYRYDVYDNGTKVTTVAVKAATKDTPKQCASETVNIQDGHTLSFKYSAMLDNGKWSAPADLLQTVKVDCPPWPKLYFNGDVSCDGAGLKVWLGTNDTGLDEELLVNDKVAYTLKSGDTGNKVDVKVPCGTTTSIGSAIHLRNHVGWNGGTLLMVGAQAG